MKIHELTEEQKKHLQELFQQNVQKAYIDCLTLADIQGLLTKEASLALKPDNWIEWEGDNGYICTGVNKNFKFYFEVGAKMLYLRFAIDFLNDEFQEGRNYTKKVEEGCNLIHSGKQFCQDWLDNYIKEYV